MKKIYIFGEETKYINYKAAVEACGGTAVFGLSDTAPADCCGLLLTGGGDVEPSLYRQKNTASFDIDSRRDAAEILLLKAFMEKEMPVLGICRGIQIINVALNGSLVQDVAYPDTHRHHPETGDSVHPISCPQGSFLRKLYGAHFSVNSAHHQAAEIPAPGFMVAAAAPDTVIEALEMPKKKLYGVQFHPERMMLSHQRPDTVDGKDIFKFFLSLCEEMK